MSYLTGRYFLSNIQVDLGNISVIETTVNTNEEGNSVIELRNICQSYDGGESFIIHDFNMAIEDRPAQGRFVVILGASGCGKSTILRYIAGLQEPTSGEVFLNGKPRDDKMAINMIFQQFSSFPWYCVLENVMLPLLMKGMSKKAAERKAMNMIKLVGLSGHEQKYTKYPLLSGGQLQRVAIARSLITNPKIILMDEPFGALDAYTRFKMQRMLAELWDTFQNTILFVTHDIQEAVFLGDDIYIIQGNPGKIRETIHVNLPLKRDRSTKKMPEFIELVNYVDDLIYEIR